jgi:hypothetical protein
MFKTSNTRSGFHSPSRRGSMMTELLVAATLLITGISLVVSVSFRTGKLWQDSRHYQLALDELTNQLERLTTLDEAELAAELADVEPSDAIKTALPNPQLTSELLADELGARVKLEIDWDRPGNPKPLALVGWLGPSAEEVP